MFNSGVLHESATEGMRTFLGAGTLLQAALPLHTLMWQVMQLLYTKEERKMEIKSSRKGMSGRSIFSTVKLMQLC